MPKKGHTEEQIVAVLRQVEAGAKVAEICRKVGISEATYYLWKRQYSGVGLSELPELRQMRGEYAFGSKLKVVFGYEAGLCVNRRRHGRSGEQVTRRAGAKRRRRQP